MTRHILTTGLAVLGLLAASTGTAPAQETDTRPNILVVVVDDAAFMDFGAYGGEARTPAIDALARRGMLFTAHRSTPLCAPSRAMLLTGLDAHRAGVGTIPEVIPPEHRGAPGYRLSLDPSVATIAESLQEAGYFTAMTGKWHLGHGAGETPDAQGFERSFALDASGADNWEQKSYMPYYRGAPWFEDGQPATLPEDFYSSRFIVDRMIDYLDTPERDGRPFFAYVAFQAIHIPLQVDPAYTDAYVDTYAGGWDALREDRLQRAIDLGLVAPDTVLAETPDRLRPWDSLTDEQRTLYTRSMAVNAGMLEAMDAHLGRLIDHLDATGALDNTLIVITSDNGPEPSHPVGEPGFRFWMFRNGISWDVETLGEPGTTAFIGPEWAFAAASPFNLFKFYASEGGLRVPLVMAGPGIAQGGRVGAATSVADIAPTLADAAGLNADPARFTGRSLAGLLTGAPDTGFAERSIGFEVSGNAAFVQGRWKLVRNLAPWGSGEWQLFDIEADPGETTDMGDSEPLVLARMIASYNDWAETAGVLPMPEGYSVHRQIFRNAIRRQLSFYWPWLAGIALVLVGGIGMIVFSRRRKTHGG